MTSITETFQPKKTQSGTNNPVYEDYLDEDKPISNQKYVCMSFVSPEKLLKQKESFFFEEFLKQWEWKNSMNKFIGFIQYISHIYHLDVQTILPQFEEFIKNEFSTVQTDFYDDYKTYIDTNEEVLQSTFDKACSFQTNIRGVKVRGTYSSQAEAERRAKNLRDVDSAHDIFVGPVGVWMPFDPEAYKTGNVEYMEDELNHLMHEKKKNAEKATQMFDERKKEMKEKAIKENREKAQSSGNKLSQTIDDKGNLVGISAAAAALDASTVLDEAQIQALRDQLFKEEDDAHILNDKKKLKKKKNIKK